MDDKIFTSKVRETLRVFLGYEEINISELNLNTRQAALKANIDITKYENEKIPLQIWKILSYDETSFNTRLDDYPSELLFSGMVTKIEPVKDKGKTVHSVLYAESGVYNTLKNVNLSFLTAATQAGDIAKELTDRTFTTELKVPDKGINFEAWLLKDVNKPFDIYKKLVDITGHADAVETYDRIKNFNKISTGIDLNIQTDIIFYTGSDLIKGYTTDYKPLNNTFLKFFSNGVDYKVAIDFFDLVRTEGGDLWNQIEEERKTFNINGYSERIDISGVTTDINIASSIKKSGKLESEIIKFSSKMNTKIESYPDEIKTFLKYIINKYNIYSDNQPNTSVAKPVRDLNNIISLFFDIKTSSTQTISKEKTESGFWFFLATLYLLRDVKKILLSKYFLVINPASDLFEKSFKNQNWIVSHKISGFTTVGPLKSSVKDILSDVFKSFSTEDLTQRTISSELSMEKKLNEAFKANFSYIVETEAGSGNSFIDSLKAGVTDLMNIFLVKDLSNKEAELRISEFNNFIEDSSFTKSNITATTFDFWRNKVFNKIADGYQFLDYKNNSVEYNMLKLRRRLTKAQLGAHLSEISKKNILTDVLENFFRAYYHKVIYTFPKSYTDSGTDKYFESLLIKDQTQNLFISNKFYRFTPSFLVRSFHKKLNLDFSNHIFRVKDNVIVQVFGDVTSSLLYDYRKDTLVTVKDFHSLLRTYNLVYRTPTITDIYLDKIMVDNIENIKLKLDEKTKSSLLSLGNKEGVSPLKEVIKDVKSFITSFYNQALDISADFGYQIDDSTGNSISQAEEDLLNFIVIKIKEFKNINKQVTDTDLRDMTIVSFCEIVTFLSKNNRVIPQPFNDTAFENIMQDKLGNEKISLAKSLFPLTTKKKYKEITSFLKSIEIFYNLFKGSIAASSDQYAETAFKKIDDTYETLRRYGTTGGSKAVKKYGLKEEENPGDNDHFKEYTFESHRYYSNLWKYLVASEGGYGIDNNKAQVKFGINGAYAFPNYINRFSSNIKKPISDLKNLSIRDAAEIAYTLYFKEPKIDSLNDPRMALIFFESYFQSGAKALKFLISNIASDFKITLTNNNIFPRMRELGEYINNLDEKTSSYLLTKLINYRWGYQLGETNTSGVYFKPFVNRTKLKAKIIASMSSTDGARVSDSANLFTTLPNEVRKYDSKIYFPTIYLGSSQAFGISASVSSMSSVKTQASLEDSLMKMPWVDNGNIFNAENALGILTSGADFFLNKLDTISTQNPNNRGPIIISRDYEGSGREYFISRPINKTPEKIYVFADLSKYGIAGVGYGFEARKADFIRGWVNDNLKFINIIPAVTIAKLFIKSLEEGYDFLEDFSRNSETSLTADMFYSVNSSSEGQYEKNAANSEEITELIPAVTKDSFNDSEIDKVILAKAYKTLVDIEKVWSENIIEESLIASSENTQMVAAEMVRRYTHFAQDRIRDYLQLEFKKDDDYKDMELMKYPIYFNDNPNLTELVAEKQYKKLGVNHHLGYSFYKVFKDRDNKYPVNLTNLSEIFSCIRSNYSFHLGQAILNKKKENIITKIDTEIVRSLKGMGHYSIAEHNSYAAYLFSNLTSKVMDPVLDAVLFMMYSFFVEKAGVPSGFQKIRENIIVKVKDNDTLGSLFRDPFNSSLAVQGLSEGNETKSSGEVVELITPHKFGLAIDLPFAWVINKNSPAGTDFFDKVISLLQDENNLRSFVKMMSQNYSILLTSIRQRLQDQALKDLFSSEQDSPLRVIIYSSHIHFDLTGAKKDKIIQGAKENV